MESRAISDARVTASSKFSNTFAASRGRLHGSRAWASKTTDVNQWLQIDLGGSNPTVTRVATQGKGYDEWVTSYKLQYSGDGASFQFYRENGQSIEKVSQPT